MPPLDKSYSYCEQVAKTEARNFYYSFLTLPAERKAAMCAIYAFFRYSDDVSDEDENAIDGDRSEKMKRWRAALEAAFIGDYGDSMILPAFHDTVKKYNIPAKYFHELIDGTEMDFSIDRYATFDDLKLYCYRVASVVGFVCIHVWGFDAAGGAAMKHAESCGYAFQLTNILRDIREDADRNRIYLPQDDLVKFGVTEASLRAGTVDDNFIAFMRFECNRARDYYLDAQKLIPLIDRNSRPTYQIMLGIYGGILDSIEKNNYDVHSRRARVSTPRKLGIVASAWINGRFAAATGRK